MKQLQHKDTAVGRCYQQLIDYTGGELRLPGVWSDVYYLPSHMISDITTVMSLFHKHEIFVDLAVPTAIYCLVEEKDIEPMHKFPPRRNKLSRDFTSFQSGHGHQFMHATKWSLLENAPGFAQLFCTQVVPFMHHGQKGTNYAFWPSWARYKRLSK